MNKFEFEFEFEFESHNDLEVAVDSACSKISEITSSKLPPTAVNSIVSALQPADILERLRRSHNILIRGNSEANVKTDETITFIII